MAKTKKKARKTGRPKNTRGGHLERLLALAHSGKNKEEIEAHLRNGNQEEIDRHIAQMKESFKSEMLYASHMEELTINKKFIKGQLLNIYARAMSAEPVLDKDGCHTGEWKSDLRTAVKAVELLGREEGMFKNNVVIDDLRNKNRAQELMEQYKDVIEIEAELKDE